MFNMLGVGYGYMDVQIARFIGKLAWMRILFRFWNPLKMGVGGICLSTLSRRIERMRTEFHCLFAAIDLECNSVILVLLIPHNFLLFNLNGIPCFGVLHRTDLINNRQWEFHAQTEFHWYILTCNRNKNKTNFLRFLLRMESHYEWLIIYENVH